LRSGILKRAKEFLKKDIGIAFPGNDNLWNEIMKINGIRNIIVHNNAWLDIKESEDKDIMNKYKKDKINFKKFEDEANDKDRFYKIQLTDIFIQELFEIINKFLMKLFDQISDWVKRTPVFKI
jgi:hypothetical protein